MDEPNVRIASKEDADELIHAVKEHLGEEGLGAADEDIVSDVVFDALDGGGVIGIIGKPGAMESSISLVTGRPWYSSTGSLESHWSFTRPQFRKSGNTKALINFAKRQAETLGIPLLIDAVTTADNAPKIRLFEREFGPRAGAVFHYRPSPGGTCEVNGSDVRMAGPEDIDHLIEICRELHAENGSFPKDEDLAIPVLQSALQGDAVIGIIGSKDKIEGTIFLRVARMWHGREPIVEEYFMFVRPQYRASRDAKALILFAKRQADRLNAVLRMCIVSRIQTEQKIQLYKRLLGEPSGAFFLYRPQGREA